MMLSSLYSLFSSLCFVPGGIYFFLRRPPANFAADKKTNVMKNLVPVFFSVNDAYAPFLAVTLASIRDNASRDYVYAVHILTDDITPANRLRLEALAREDFRIAFYPLAERLLRLPGVKKLQEHCFEAFASPTIYFRLFIPELFPQYDKALYLDADIVVPGDISRLYREPLGDKLVGAVADYSIQKIAPFMRYIDDYVGVDHANYVNSGVLLLNCRRLREEKLADRFLHWVGRYGLETVAPDQDYLNVLCWNGIQYLDPSWNAMPSESITQLDNPQIIHFNLASKPWFNESVPYDEVFWKYAAVSGFEADIRARRTAFLRDSGAVTRYQDAVDRLIRLASRLSRSECSFRSLISSRREFRLCS